MTETELNALLAGITPANEAARAAAHAHWASLAKPLGGLGRLETMLEDAAALTGSAEFDLSRRAVVVLCADNGVVAQGVSQTGQEVTRAVAENLAMRRTSVCQMARAAHCDVMPMSTGTTSQWAVRAIWHTLVRRAARFSATARVTLWSVWLTP